MKTYYSIFLNNPDEIGDTIAEYKQDEYISAEDWIIKQFQDGKLKGEEGDPYDPYLYDDIDVCVWKNEEVKYDNGSMGNKTTLVSTANIGKVVAKHFGKQLTL